MTHGLFEAIIEDTLTVSYKAVNMGERLFNRTLYRGNFHTEDIREWFQDYSSKICMRIGLVSDNTVSEHRWTFKVTTSLNVIVGADPRDLEVDPTELEEIPFEPEEDCNYGLED